MKEQGVVAAAALNRRLAMLQKVLLLGHEAHSDFASALQLHSNVMRSGAALAAHVKKLDGLGKDAQGRMTADANYAVLLSVLKSRDAVSSAAHALHVQKEAFEKAHPDASDEFAELGMFWAAGSPDCFEDLLRSGMVLDVVCRTCCTLKEKTTAAGNRLEAILASVIRDKSWKADLTTETSIDEVLAQGKATLMKLPEKKNIKSIMDAFSKALRSLLIRGGGRGVLSSGPQYAQRVCTLRSS